MCRVGVGFCGALTTFSTFSMDVVRFIEAGQWARAGSYVIASNLVSIGSATFAYTFVRRRFRLK
jgi:fluoride exporter